MKGTALLQSMSWLQVSLALHAALGFALYAVAPQWVHGGGWDAHVYQVTLPPEKLDDFTTDESGALAAAEEETLCIERDEPAPEEGVYDGPPEHQHRWTRTATSPVCTICGKPTSWTARCSVQGCFSFKGGGHRCVVASCGTRKAPAKPKSPATK